jgi:hypothetical protein
MGEVRRGEGGRGPTSEFRPDGIVVRTRMDGEVAESAALAPRPNLVGRRGQYLSPCEFTEREERAGRGMRARAHRKKRGARNIRLVQTTRSAALLRDSRFTIAATCSLAW